MKVEVLNALNNQKLISWNTTITADMAGPKDENGLPINYIKSAAFGTATGPTSYPRPRPGQRRRPHVPDRGRTAILELRVKS